MTEAQELRKHVERALAFAHAAAEEPTPYRIAAARTQAEQLVPRVGRVQQPAFTLGEARQIFALMRQLRAVLQVIDRQVQPRTPSSLPS